MANCPNCGIKVDEEAKFCPKCGAKLYAAEGAHKPIEYEIKYRPSYSLLEVHLPPGGSITAEAGSMTYMSSNIEVKTRTRLAESGVWGTIKVSLLGGETLFINDYIARGGEGKVGFVSAPLGDITCLKVSPERGYIVQSSAYIASTPGVTLDTQWQGFTKGLFGQNLFMIKTLGQGLLFINTFGAIDMHELRAGESIVVDNFHLAALSTTCQYKVRMFGGLKSTILGGEGLVTEVTGPGEVYIQTKNPQEFVHWLWRYIAPLVRAEASRGGRSGVSLRLG
ncbi:MAG: TIGR00266 family protein [Nitrososphaerota archaeon]|nr:TIGR00266 family protein [Candidatus Bathyarchaeota archaeon]MDW8049102.1 TIGR00266 family protein [Nitrososphaerota archaeon]